MGGRKFRPQEELTREVLLQYLKGKGDIREVEGLLDITVQTMTGKSFDVVLESGSTAQIGLLKSEIEEAEGTPACRQDLFVLREGKAAAAEEGSAIQCKTQPQHGEGIHLPGCAAEDMDQ